MRRVFVTRRGRGRGPARGRASGRSVHDWRFDELGRLGRHDDRGNRCDDGRLDDGRSILTKAYGSFTEGFDMPDLKVAKALLEELV